MDYDGENPQRGEDGNVRRELEPLCDVARTVVPEYGRIRLIIQELKQVNERLREIDDSIRECETKGDFGERFIEMAGGVHKTNDGRAELKRRINECSASFLDEEKLHECS